MFPRPGTCSVSVLPTAAVAGHCTRIRVPAPALELAAGARRGAAAAGARRDALLLLLLAAAFSFLKFTSAVASLRLDSFFTT